jgi:hypothetical protein
MLQESTNCINIHVGAYINKMDVGLNMYSNINLFLITKAHIGAKHVYPRTVHDCYLYMVYCHFHIPDLKTNISQCCPVPSIE